MREGLQEEELSVLVNVPVSYLTASSTSRRFRTPPKSKLIGQEDELQCALRVVPDVIGVNLSDIHIEEGFRAEIKYLSGDKPKRSIYYVARLTAKNARIETGGVGSMNILWWSSKQAQEKVFFKNMQDIISKATSFIELRQQARREAAAAASAASAENSPHLPRLRLDRRPGSGSSRGDVDRHGSRAGSDEETAIRSASGRGTRDGATHNGGGLDGRGSPLASHSWRDGGAANISGERTHAADDGAGGAGGGRNHRPSAAATAASNPMYKTRLCERDATDGNCPYGVRCIFAHGPRELRERTGPPTEVHVENTVGVLYKTKICERFVTEGHCQYGSRCNYAHGPSELRERPAANPHHEGDREQGYESNENGISRTDGAGLLRRKIGETQPSAHQSNNGVRQLQQDHGFHPMLLKRGEPADERSISKSLAPQTQRGAGEDLERHHHAQHPVQHVFAPHARHAAEHPESGFHPMLLKRGESLDAFLDPAATSSAARTAPALNAAHHHQHPHHDAAPPLQQQHHQQPPPRVMNHSPGPGVSLLSTFSRPRTPLTAPHTPPGPGKPRSGAGGGRGDHASHHQQQGSRKDLAGSDDKPWVHVVNAPPGVRPSSGPSSTAAGGGGGGAASGGGGGLPTPSTSAVAPPLPPGERPAASAVLEEKLAAALSKILLAQSADSGSSSAAAASSFSSSTLSPAPQSSETAPATLAPPTPPTTSSTGARPLTPADEIKELTRLEFKHDLSKRQVFGILFCALTHDGAYESARVRARADLFRQVVRSRADQELLIRTVEKKIEKSPEAVQAKFLAVVRDLYDTDLVEEDVLLAWFDGKHDHPEVAGRVAPFITWLRTAEEED
ncbi:nudix (nucleoside diphosphate linked moiety X)-type motif 2 [Geranomyces variabilis]|nr:nudix (nucleoside diphosphate linked moiety X)-type motif 2 [Geranomyces variabilis]